MADDDFDDVVRRADPDRWLSSRFVSDPAQRADVVLLYAFDRELARAERVASNSLVAEIRLTWWREVVEEIQRGGSVRAHPLVQALSRMISRRGLSHEPFLTIIEARIAVLDLPWLSEAQAVDWAEAVAGSAARLAAGILDPGAPADAAMAAGMVWGMKSLVGSGRSDDDRLRTRIAAELPAARRQARRLSPAAFPSVAHATLARRAGRTARSPLANQLALLLAVATGRL